jgi:hypothetical protein
MEGPVSELDQHLLVPVSFPSKLEIVGAVAAVVPFVFSVTSSSITSVNGVVTGTYRDWAAIACGVVAVGCGLLSLASLRRTDSARRTIRWAAILGLLVLGALQLARGVGLVGNPASMSTAEPRIEPATLAIQAGGRLVSPAELGPSAPGFEPSRAEEA